MKIIAIIILFNRPYWVHARRRREKGLAGPARKRTLSRAKDKLEPECQYGDIDCKVEKRMHSESAD